MSAFVRIAAIFILTVGLGTMIWQFSRNDKQLVEQLAINEQKIQPGSNKAYLQLANGQLIYLDSSGNGQLAQQGSLSIIKNDNQVVYNSSAKDETAYGELNTLRTPKGGQFRLLLPDSSQVWLNAASSISFPTSFNPKERNVSISGEVYFEVKQEKNRPFRITIKPGTEVEVLGTSFNIQSYHDEKEIETTLLEGSVKLITAKSQVVLKPHQQAIIPTSGGEDIQVNKQVDIDDVMAWKNGYFSFNQADLSTIMRQISRWYDVEVIYRGALPKRRFGGELARATSLEQVLAILQASNINFKIENKTIIVQP